MSPRSGIRTASTATGGLTQAVADGLYDALGTAASLVTGLLEFKGSTNASTNPNYPAASKGDAYVVTVAGKVGGASGKSVDVGDFYLATADNAGGTEASVGTSWSVLEHNLVGALLSANNLSDLTSASSARTNLGLGDLAPANADASTVEVSAGSLRIKDTGVSRAKLAALLAQDCIQVAVTDLSTALTTGDGQAYWVVPSHLNGLKLKSVTIALTVAQSSSGAPQMQMANATQGWDLLSTRPVIAANKWLDTETGGTAAVVDTASSHDVLTTGDRIRFDIDTAGTGAKGLLATFYVGS